MNLLSSEGKEQLAEEFRELTRKLKLVKAETEDCNRKIVAYKKLLDNATQQKNKLLASNNQSDPAGGPSLRQGSFVAVVEASTRDSPKLELSTPNVYPITLEKPASAAKLGVRSDLNNIAKKSRSIMLCSYARETSFISEDIVAYFSNYGVVINLTDPTGKKNKRNANYCFLKFQDYQSAEEAIAGTPHWIGSVKYSAFKAKDF